MIRLVRSLVFLAVVLCGGFLAAAPTPTYYAVSKPNDRGLATIAGEFPVQMPCCITGTLEKATSQLTVLMRPRQSGTYKAEIFTYTGTGAVYRVSMLQGTESDPVEFERTHEVVLTAGMEVGAFITASTFRANSVFVLRIGEFDPFKVTFNGNGGTVSKASDTYVPGAKYGTLPTATLKGQTFAGWATAPTNGARITKDSPVYLGYPTLYAQWGATAPETPTEPEEEQPAAPTNAYFVSYNANGGVGTMPVQPFRYGTAQALTTNAFVHTNFTFKGWALSPTGQVVYANCQIVSNLTTTADETIDLFASWKEQKLPEDVKRAVVGGVTWCYTADGGEATIENLSASAIDSSFEGNLVIPEMLDGHVVTTIGDNAFLGCAGVTNVVIPLTVTEIGDSAFAGCLELRNGITIPESVETLGSSVFSGCTHLRIVRFLGDCPDVSADLYEGAPANLISGVLRIRSGWGEEEEVEVAVPGQGDDGDDDEGDGDEDEDEDDVTTTVTVKTLDGKWPEGGFGRGIYWLKGVKVYTVSLDCNGGKLDEEDAKFHFYLPGRLLGDLPEPSYTLKSSSGDDETDEPEMVFLGWYTQRKGGTLISPDHVVDANLKLYAHWAVGEADVSGWNESLYEDAGDFNPLQAHLYEGYLYESAGSNDCRVVGLVTLKVAKETYDRAADDYRCKATASVTLLGRKKLTMTGSLDESGTGDLVSPRAEDELSVALTANGLSGSFGDYALSGARNRAASSAQIDRLFVSTSLARWTGTWSMVFQATDVVGEGAAFAADGYLALTAVVGSKGRTRVTGTLPDGMKVSVAGQMIFGDGCACVPVLVPLYAGRSGGFAFLLWFCTDEDEPFLPWGVSRWNAWAGKHPFTAALEVVNYGRVSSLAGEGSFALGGEFDFEDVSVEEDLLPADVSIVPIGSRWALPRADRVKFDREDGGYEALTDFGNPAALKLVYSAKDGTFKGSFKVYGVTDAGRGKTMTATVVGAMVEGVGYGSAVIRSVGSVPVVINPE